MGARISSVWCVGALASFHGFTPEQADQIWAVLVDAEPAQSPSGFIAQFEGVAVGLGFLPEPVIDPVAPVEGTPDGEV